MPSRESHDGAYKLLFSHPLMVRELLEESVQQRSDDVAWQVRMAGDGASLCGVPVRCFGFAGFDNALLCSYI